MRSKYEIIKELEALDLGQYPYKLVHKLISEMDIYGTMFVKVPKGETLLRARPNRLGEEFSKASDLTYVPSDKNIFYRRASTPYNTMFYGSLFPKEIYEGSIDTARLIGVCEVCSLLRDKKIYEGEETITFGRWRVMEDIPICVVIHNKNHIERNPFIKKFFTDYNGFLLKNGKEFIQEYNLVMEFFANQFAKEVTNEYDYLISAFYANKMSNLVVAGEKIGGVLYPSVRTEGEGVNVAISPWYADNCLELDMVIECTVYKKGENVVLGNDRLAALRKGELTFSLQKMDNPKEYVSREIAFKILNSL